jgi:hypothetical protein
VPNSCDDFEAKTVSAIVRDGRAPQRCWVSRFPPRNRVNRRGSRRLDVRPAPELVNSLADMPRLPGGSRPPARHMLYASMHLLHATL